MMLLMDKIIRNSALPLLLMLAVALISSCTASREDDLRPAGGLTGLTLTITPEQPQVEEILRATERGQGEENKITSVDVFVFNQAGTTLLGSARGKSVPSSSGGAVSVTVDNISYKGTDETVLVAVVANATGRIAYTTSGLTLETLESLAVTETSDTARTPLVMYGKAELTANSSGQVTGNVTVKRLAAAIEVKGAEGSKITIGETYLVSAPKGATLTGEPLSPDALDKPTTHNAGERAYVYPNHPDGKMVYVVFKAKNASGKEFYYFFAPKEIKGKQQLTANTLYRVTVKSLSADGYDSLEAALAAIKAGGDDQRQALVYSVAEWSDLGRSETVFFGRYFLRIAQSMFVFDQEQMDRLTYVYTNAPALALIPPAEGKFSDTKQHAAAWATSALHLAQEDYEGPGRRYTLNVGVFQYHSVNAGDTRHAFGWVRATGIHTNDLQVQYSITQDNINRFHPDVVRLSADPAKHKIDATEGKTLTTKVTTNLPRLGWRLFDVKPSAREVSFIDSVYVLGSHGEKVVLWDDTKTPKFDAEKLENRHQQIGPDKLYIVTKPMADKNPDVATITLYAGEIGGRIFHKLPIRVYRSFQLDYKIIYPEGYGMPYDMRRDKYVIETPLGWDWENAYKYSVDVSSNLRWEATVEPASDGSDIKWVTITNGSSSGNQKFQVRVADRKSGWSNGVSINGTRMVDHFLPAREAHISLKGYVEGSDEAMAVRDITVYQGGYVKIGDNYWLDRNLKTGFNYAANDIKMSAPNSLYMITDKFFEENSKRIQSTLYPYAIPVGHKTTVYGAYADNNVNYLPNSSEDPADYGEDGYFFSKAPTSGYAQGITEQRWARLYSDNYSGVTHYGYDDSDDFGGYFYYHPYIRGGKVYIDFIRRDIYGRLEFRDRNIILGVTPEESPCPPGWNVPTVDQLKSLVGLLGQTYGKPTPLMNLDETYSAIDGEMGEHNSGRYLVADPMTRSSSTGVHWYLPAAGYRPFNHADIRTMGVTGAYKTYELVNPDALEGIKSQLLYFSPTKVWMHIDNWAFTASVRCVRSAN